MNLSRILGLNARTQKYTYKYNSRRGKNIADSKIQTARVLRLAKVPYPKIYKKFRRIDDINDFAWDSLPDRFAVKPSRGQGGEGIIVIKRKLKDGGWLTTQKQRIGVDDLKLHILDILEGAYSMGNVPDVAFIQEYVGRAKIFRRWAYRGTPDIRIIVFNSVPVMAMLRLPTRESGGRANLYQGALGVGVDIATGVTTRAIWHEEPIIYKPGTERKLNGIKVPNWTTILRTVVQAQIASTLGYVGVDIVLHPEKGPMVLELNAQPGLKIQLANMLPLKKRLEKIEDLEVRDVDHGVEIAKAIFSSKSSTRNKLDDEVYTIKAVEKIKILKGDKKKRLILAKIDTGAWSSAIDVGLATDLGLFDEGKIKGFRRKLSSLGEENRPVIPVTVWVSGKKISTHMTVSDRSLLRYLVIIGREDLKGFVVNPEIERKNIRQAKWLKKAKWV